MLSFDECVERLRVEGARLGDIAAATAFAAAVPGCPGWDVDALVRHIGEVHRWATTIVRDRLPTRPPFGALSPDGHDALLDWYRDGHARLLEVLSSGSPADALWSWGAAPSPLAFWARRQAHETAIHRLDVEQASGCPTRFPPRAAADGIDEWLMLASPRVKHDETRSGTLQVACTDLADQWFVELRAEGITVQRGAAPTDCSVSGAASDLFALLMNRRGAAGLHVEGDAGVLHAWRNTVRFL